MSTRAGLLVLALIFAAIAVGVALRDARAQGTQVRCIDGQCMVPQAMLIELVQKADLAEEYARMCRWPG